nr:DUF1958 domain-containing protein [Streptococcus himalayensis]
MSALLLLSAPISVSADELMDITRASYPNVQEINRPKSTIVLDANTGDIVWQDNVDEVRDPASMSKLMTLYLVFDAIKEGRLSLDTVITATAADQAISKIYEISNNNIVAGVDYTVSELITMTAVPSSNVTTVMLANYLSDYDADAFLNQMNAKAKELGMTNTKWFNASGAAAVAFKGYYTPYEYDNYSTNQTTARDMGILGYYFVKNHPEILNFTKDSVVTVKAGTPYEETFETYNYSLPDSLYGIEGVDGLKTGSSPQGAFNYIATVKRGEQRFVCVVMGVGDWSDQDGEYYRHPFGNALMEKAFKDYEYKKVLSAGKQDIDGKTYQVSNDFYATVKKGTSPTLLVENNILKVDNGLETASSTISDGVKVELAESGLGSVAKQIFPSSNRTKSWTQFLWDYKFFIVLPLLVLIFILVIETLNNRKKKEKAVPQTTGTYSRREKNKNK